MRWRAALPALLLLPLTAAAGPAFPPGSECAAAQGADIAARYAQLAALPEAQLEALRDTPFAVAVDDADGESGSVRHDERGGVLRLLYRMNFNNVAEGWSWQPQADPAREDYYRYKFLPLGTREAETAPARIEEDLPGRAREVRTIRRDAYYFAFDNPYELYARHEADDDTGFAADVKLPPAAARTVRLVALGRWTTPFRAESTTYWRATDSRPVNLTLKNRYFMGRLEAVWFCDAEGRVLARLQRQGSTR